MKIFIKNVLKAVLFVALTAGVVSCADFRKVRVRSAGIEYITPTGLRSAGWKLNAKVENNTRQFTISDVEGKVYRSGTPIGVVTSADVVVEKGVVVYSVRGNIALEKGVSIMEIISLVTNFNVDDFTVDLTLKVRPKGGTSQKIKLKNLSVSDLTGSSKRKDI